MARLIAGMGTSHVPGVGAAMDNGKTDEPYWRELFEGFAHPARLARGQCAGREHRRVQ